ELAQRLQLEGWVSEHLTEIQDLVIVPDHILGYVPFAALPFTEPESEPVKDLRDFKHSKHFKHFKYFGDRFRLRILPDCQSRPQGSQATTSASASNLSIVEDTTGTLVLSRHTSQTLVQRHQIPDACYLRATTATVENYQTLFKQARTLYANHLVQVNLDTPLNTQIQCIDGTVSFAQLLTWRCSNLSRIVFPYCQSVFKQFESLKYRLSFVNSLLRIGAQEVVCPLWFLDNVAVSLICLFWDQLAQTENSGTENSATALHQAQVRLRTLTGQELSEQYRPEIETSLSQSANHQKVNDQRTLLVWLCQQDYPFAHPYYWAGFVVYGWGD
ncbi:MAG: CHAT domain-containing protein, partial [Microcoleaceae cyanobacterium]